MRVWLLTLLVFVACARVQGGRSANPYLGPISPNHSDENAVVLDATSAIGVAASVARRADGECYTPCVKGTACNLKTGFCDELPCRGECGPRERCDSSGVIDRCVDDGSSFDVRAVSHRPDAGGGRGSW